MLESINLFGIYYEREHPMQLLTGAGNNVILSPEGCGDGMLTLPHHSKRDQSSLVSF